jgi:hypothetical protein
MEDREHTVVARIQQGADVALTALQLCIARDFRQVALEFPNHASQVE